MNLLLSVALVLPLGGVALVCCVALLGILMLSGAVRGIGAIKANVEQRWPRCGKNQAWT